MFEKISAYIHGDKYLPRASRTGKRVDHYQNTGASVMVYSDGSTLLINDHKGLKKIPREQMSPADLALYDICGTAAYGVLGFCVFLIGTLVGSAL